MLGYFLGTLFTVHALSASPSVFSITCDPVIQQRAWWVLDVDLFPRLSVPYSSVYILFCNVVHLDVLSFRASRFASASCIQP